MIASLNRRHIYCGCLIFMIGAIAICINPRGAWKHGNKLLAERSGENRPTAQGVNPPLYECKFWRMPLTSRYHCYNVSRSSIKSAEDDEFSALCERLQRFGVSFAEANSIETSVPYGTIYVAPNHSVLGIALLPTEGRVSSEFPIGRVDSWIGGGRSPMAYRSYAPELDISKFATISVSSLDSIQSLGETTFLDFGVAGFSGGFWDSLSRTVSLVGIKGIVVVRTKELMSVREGQVIPGINGVVVHLQTSSDLKEVGQAFPNLKILTICMPNGKIVAELFHSRVLVDSFPNLIALNLVSDRLSEFGAKVDREACAKPDVSFSIRAVPSRLRWFCLDGSLVSARSMVEFDDFARVMRNYKAGEIKQSYNDNEMAIMFMSYGYAGGSAGAIDYQKYFDTERYWCSRPN